MTLSMKTLKKSKIIYLLLITLVLSMVSPSQVFAAADKPAAPTFNQSITTFTKDSVIVTVNYPSGANIVKYKIGGGGWQDYTVPVSLTSNCTFKAKYKNNNQDSDIGELVIDNITTGRVAPILTPNTTASTTENITVTITYPSNVNKDNKKYRLDGGNWEVYNGPVSLTSNCIIEAIYGGINNLSELGSLTIDNITTGSVADDDPSSIAGDAPTLTPSTKASTTDKVVVTITFPSGVDTFLSKQVSLDNGSSWMGYTGPVSVTDNTTMKAMYTYLNGSDTYSSLVGVLTIGNIDNIDGNSTGDANNGPWATKSIQKNYTPEADLMFRIGDIDNFSLGFQSGYDPFSGLSTKTHSYPWDRPNYADHEPAGLDTIMEISGFDYDNSSGTDGYTNTYHNWDCVRVQPVTMDYDLAGINVTSAKLQLFVDDLQAGVRADNGSNSYYRAMDVSYVVTINGNEIPEFSSYINQLNQSGPIGKLITFNLPENYLQLVRTGELVIKIDDPTPTSWGDGYAIDFVKLLINSKDVTNTASISGTVTDVDTNAVLSGAKVTACGLTTTTDSNGNYTLPNLNLGLAVVQASNTGYAPASLTKDLDENIKYTGVDFKLKKTQKLGTPTISQDILVPTNSSVNITIVYPDKPTQKFYSISQSGGDIVWVPYTGSFKVLSNCTVKAYSASTGKVDSDVATYDVTNIDTTVPSAPTLTPDITAPTNKSVIVTAVYPPTAIVKQISVDGGATWTSYTEPVTIEFNTTVVAKCSNSVGTQSPETRLPITNINKNVPATPKLAQDITELTNKDVTVTATYPSEAVIKEISINGGETWAPYTQPVIITQNTTVKARCANSVGTPSKEAILIITNIDKSVPPTPVLLSDNTKPTNQSLNVLATYDQVAIIKEISVDNGATWKSYSGAEVIALNTIVQAKCTNAAGTESLIAKLQITNIDKSVPKAPVIKSSNTNPTNQNITVTVTYPTDAQDRQISLDNGDNWKSYTAEEIISANTTIKAKYKNAVGTQSDIGILNVANIDKNIPDAPTIRSSNTNPTNKDIIVTIKFPTTSFNEQISLDNGSTWKRYEALEVTETISANTTVLAKYENYVKTPSKQGSLTITNINKDVPSAPTIKPSTTDVVVVPNTLTISVVYPAGADKKLISVDAGTTWSHYTGIVEIKNNTTVYATYVNIYGTISDKGSYTISKFDTKPNAPTFTPSTEDIVAKPATLTLTVNYPENATKKYISLDNKENWKAYVQPEVITDNMTVYAKCETALGTSSEISQCTLSNFDIKPDMPTFSQDINMPTTGHVKVTVSTGQSDVTIEWLDGTNWVSYSGVIDVSENTTISARCKSSLGTYSDIARHQVTNIRSATTPTGTVRMDR